MKLKVVKLKEKLYLTAEYFFLSWVNQFLMFYNPMNII